MERPKYVFHARDKTMTLGRRTRLMGVVNITPDSFYDGGRFLDEAHALDHCLGLLEAGADILDLGGESSRPGAQPVPASVELDRVGPVLQKLRPATGALLSVDTYKVDVARECLRMGADIINDITSLRFSPEMASVISETGAGLILMHMRGTPATMQDLPPSPDILSEIATELTAAVEKARAASISDDHLMLDPGIGFGKTFKDNLRILNRLSFLTAFRLPVLVGPSRKSFLGRILDSGVEDRLLGTVAASVASVLKGAHVVRVHDIAEIRQAVSVADAILAEEGSEC